MDARGQPGRVKPQQFGLFCHLLNGNLHFEKFIILSSYVILSITGIDAPLPLFQKSLTRKFSSFNNVEISSLKSLFTEIEDNNN